jgi:regulatory protein
MTFDAALNRFQRQCSRMEYCSRDIYRKALKALDGDAAAAERLVAALVADRFVDDLRYASAFAREKASLQGWGPVKIAFQLRGKGIPDETIRIAMEDIDPGKASAKLEKTVADKYRLLREDPQCRLKLLKFALGRGYGYDEASAAVEKAMKGATE